MILETAQVLGLFWDYYCGLGLVDYYCEDGTFNLVDVICDSNELSGMKKLCG